MLNHWYNYRILGTFKQLKLSDEMMKGIVLLFVFCLLEQLAFGVKPTEAEFKAVWKVVKKIKKTFLFFKNQFPDAGK